MFGGYCQPRLGTSVISRGEPEVIWAVLEPEHAALCHDMGTAPRDGDVV